MGAASQSDLRAYAGGSDRLSASAAPGDRREPVAPAGAPEMTKALNAPHYTGPHSSLLQASASMPSLWVAGDNPQGLETRDDRAQGRRSSSNTDVVEERSGTPQNYQGSRDDLARVLCSMMEAQIQLQRDRDNREERRQREKFEEKELMARLKREQLEKRRTLEARPIGG